MNFEMLLEAAKYVDRREGSSGPSLYMEAGKSTGRGEKITIVGVGRIGLACAHSLVTQEVASEITLIDRDFLKLENEFIDLKCALPFYKNVRITASSGYSEAKDSKLCIITADARKQRDLKDETRLKFVNRRVDTYKSIIPELVKCCKKTIILIVSNEEVDIMTYIAWKLSGFQPKQVIGSGANLDSFNFQYLINDTYNLSPASVHGWIIGEHGDKSVAIWSGRDVAGKPVGCPPDLENCRQIVMAGAALITARKGATWALGASLAKISVSLTTDLHNNIYSVSTFAKGFAGIENEVYLSLPCFLGYDGVTTVVKLKLSDEDKKKLHNSSDELHRIQGGIDI